MTAALDLNTLAQLSAERMASCLVEGVALALLAGLLLRVVRRQNSGTRFTVWFAVLVAIGALAVLGGAWTSSVSPSSGAGFALTLPNSWASYVFAGWALTAAAGLVRIAVGLWHLHTLRKSCVPLDIASLNPELQRTVQASSGARTVRICTSDLVSAPTAIGFIKPAVVIPGWLMKELPAAELQQVLLHELAHLRRWDDWTNLVQKIVKAILFFHPAVWWVEPRISLEREMACDDAVLAETANPHAYARCLVHLAEKRFVRRGVALAQAAVSRMRHTSLRVAQILDGQPRTTRIWRPALGLIAIVVFAGAILRGQVPRLIAFQDDSVPAVATAPMVAQDLHTAKSLLAAGLPATAPSNTPQKARANRPVLMEKLQAKPPLPQRNDPGLDANPARQTNPTAVVAARSAAPQVMPPATLLVFVESRTYGADGLLGWQVAVWRITLQPDTNPAAKGVTRKSI